MLYNLSKLNFSLQNKRARKTPTRTPYEVGLIKLNKL